MHMFQWYIITRMVAKQWHLRIQLGMQPFPFFVVIFFSHAVCLDNGWNAFYCTVVLQVHLTINQPTKFWVHALLSFRIIKSVDVALQLSQTYKVRVLEVGHAFVLFFFSVVIGLIDSTLDDWGLRMTPIERPSVAVRSTEHIDMDIDFRGSPDFKGNEHHEQMRRTNSFMAIEVLGKLTESRKSVVILRLVHLNMYVCHYCIVCLLESSLWCY